MAWYHIPGQEQDIVISTRVRFARNLAPYPFPSRLDAPRAREIITGVGEILEKNGFARHEFADISRAAAYSLVEKHYASPAFIKVSLPHALFLNEPCNLAVMVCEEDHIRLQCIQPGLALRDAYAGADKIEALLDGAFDMAFDGRLGYLTGCPTGLGTAMRASVMMCLPLLTETGHMEAMAVRLGEMGLTLRGLYGEGSGAAGYLYQVSNRTTLGVTEVETLDRVAEAVRQIIGCERHLRETVTGTELDKLTDRVCRAEGILRHAYRLSSSELLSLLADLRMGAAMGILPRIKVETLTALLIEAMPATLSVSADTPPRNDHERDILRAQMVKERLQGA